MLRARMAQTQIANHLNVSRMTIYRLMIPLRDTGNMSDRPRSGRPDFIIFHSVKRKQNERIWIWKKKYGVTFLLLASKLP
jgi:transposase